MFRGTLDDFTLPEILRMLAFSKKTGTLKISRRAGTGRITFREGAVVYAETDLSSSRLGEKLVAAGKITPVQLRQSLDAQATAGDRLGRILLSSQAVTRQDLHEAVRAQVEEAAYELMCWEAGEFTWEPGAQEKDDTEVALDIDDLMLDVTSRLQEQDVMKRRLEMAEAVPRLVPHPAQGPADINISPAQWRVLVLVDGHRSVDALADTAGLARAETISTLHDLVTAGLIEVDPVVEPVPEPEEEVPASSEAAPEEVPSGRADAFASTGSGGTRPARAATAGARPSSRPDPAGDLEPPDEWFQDPEVADVSSGVSVAFPPPEPSVEDLPRVDRSAAVRELSGLFDEPKEAPKPPPPPAQGREPRKQGTTEAAASAKGLIARFGRKPPSS